MGATTRLDREQVVKGRTMKPKETKTQPAASGKAAAAPHSSPLSVSHRVAWLVLVISLLASAGGWLVSLRLESQADHQMVAEEAAALRASLGERLALYQNVLHGAAGLFAASVSVDRREWTAYLDRVSVDERFPGINGVGFAAYVQRSELDAFLAATRADGAPEFEVKSGSDGDELLVVKYLTPAERNGAILGLDMSSDPLRIEAAEQCRASGDLVVSLQVTLSENGGETGPTGFLMFVPVYRSGTSTASVEERRRNCVGFVYARFVMHELMGEVLGNVRLPLRVEVIDRAPQVPGSAIFDAVDMPPDYEPLFEDEGVVSVGGRAWIVRVSSTPTFDKGRTRFGSTMAGLAGLLVSLLLFWIAWSLSHTRQRAVVIASGMTAKLRRTNDQLQREMVDRENAQRSIKDSEALYHSLVGSLPMSIMRKDMEGRLTFANQQFCNELGKSIEEIRGKTEFDLLPDTLAARHKQEDDRITESGTSLDTVQELDLPDEEPRFAQVIKTPLRNGVGEVIGLQSISWDVTDKHRAEEELQRERDLLHALLSNIPDRIYFKDEESRFLRVSRAMLDLFKVKDASEVIGKTDFEFFGEEHARQAYEDEQGIIRTGQPVIGLVEKLDMPGGQHRWASTTKMPMRDVHGRVIGTFGVTRDITQMKDAETDLRLANDRLQREVADRERAQQSVVDSQALYHSLVESLPMNIIRKDLEGRFTFANQLFCNEVGKTLDGILGQTEASLFPAEQAEKHMREDDHIMRTGTSLEEVQEVRLPDAVPQFFQVIKTPLRDGAGDVIGVQGIFWDVTDKHRTEYELRQERDLLHALLDNVPDRIYFKDRESRILRNNRAHAALFSLDDPRASVGKTDFDFFTSEHAQQAFDDEQRIIRTGEPIIGLVEKETLFGEEIRWVSTTKMPLMNDKGEIVGTFGITRDITRMKRAAEALEVAKEAAEEASRTKSQFLANMSHELRTPLNSIIGFSNILTKNREGRLAQSELSFLQRILSNGKHLLELINQILDLSKIEARKVELQVSAVSLAQLVTETIEQQEGLVRERPVQLLYDLPDQTTPIQADPDKLKQVLINLMGNALKFTEEGSVTVRVITDRADHCPLRIDVVDTGVGIPEEKLGAIFEAFQQADATTARKFGGTGLGLTISQALCQLMGYRIEVSSESGKGSTFSIILKSQQPGAEVQTLVEHAAPAPTAGGPGLAEVPAHVKGKRVLVIDDESDSRMLLRHTLQEFGCEVIEAASGPEGLRMAQRSHPHLITVDLMMPRMTGTEVVGAIKRDPNLKHIPVVVVSIVSGEHRGQILGAVDLLQKPIVRNELLDALGRNLPRAKPRILVVDDEEDSRELMRSLLEPEYYHVRTVVNAHEASEALSQSSWDLVMLDLMMPDMDGFTFLKMLRADLRHRNLPVVVVTAKDLTSEEAAGLKEKASDVLQKSAGFDADLKGVLRRVFDSGDTDMEGRVNSGTADPDAN